MRVFGFFMTVLNLTISISLLAACSAVSTANSSVHAEALEDNGDTQEFSWIDRAFSDFESIKPGMTREQVESRFPLDGGQQSVSPVRFTHPRSEYLKVDVEFEFERDVDEQGRAIWAKTDTVTKVSKPYIERPSID